MDWILQAMILCLGGASIWLIGRLESWRRWGYILGLISQPFWLWASIANEQWGIAVLALWYTYAFWQGVYNYWLKKEATS